MNRTLCALVILSGCWSICGCTSARPSGLPIGSVLVAEGWLPMSFAPAEDGRLYVWDQDDRRIRLTLDLARGQGAWFDVQSGIVRVGGGDAVGRVGSYARYQLFFHPAVVPPRGGGPG